MSGASQSISRRIVIAGAIELLLWLATVLPSTLSTESPNAGVLGRIGAEFLAIRTFPNRTLLCWAIKLSPTAYVADGACVRRYRKHQITMIYGDVEPSVQVRDSLDRRLASVRAPFCRYSVPPVAMVTAPAGSNRSRLAETVRNFIVSYGMANEPRDVCSVCDILAIRRVLPCRTIEPGTVVLYNDCLKQVPYATLATIVDETVIILSHPLPLPVSVHPFVDRSYQAGGHESANGRTGWVDVAATEKAAEDSVRRAGTKRQAADGVAQVYHLDTALNQSPGGRGRKG